MIAAKRPFARGVARNIRGQAGERIEAGLPYANRPKRTTTRPWLGYEPFASWKGSGSTGKAIASSYYLPLSLHEQSRTVVTEAGALARVSRLPRKATN